MKLSPKKPKLINHPVLTSHQYSRYHDDDDFDRGEEFLILGLGFGIWGIYWAVIHFLDKFTFNFIPWWIEPFTAFPLIGLVALIEVFGKNPLYWWPLFWGTKIKIREEDDPIKHTLDIEEITKRMGGPLNIHVVNWETLKFRRKKDITKYLLFKL
tara:strand:- start:93 stop:557 length:465 start_codon:yes stop_codon:yes gene_type:complete